MEVTADEIRNTQGQGYADIETSRWTKEVAVQLAELNETLKKLLGSE